MNTDKTKDIVSRLLEKIDAPVNYIKLLKLVYIVDREAIRLRGCSITSAQFLALEHGPLCDELNEEFKLLQKGQGSYFKVFSSKDLEISLIKNGMGQPSLSENEIKIVDAVFRRFGNWSKDELIDYTHTFGEWKKTGGSRIRISRESVADNLDKKSDKKAQIKEFASIEKFMDSFIKN